MVFHQIVVFGSRYFLDIKQWIFFISCLVLTVANITSFHLIPTDYEDIIAGKQAPFFRLVRHAQGLVYFEILQDEIQTSITIHQDEIFALFHARNTLMNQLERALVKQPQSTELLRALVVLHQRQGDVEEAGEYLKRLRALDPTAQ